MTGLKTKKTKKNRLNIFSFILFKILLKKFNYLTRNNARVT